MASDTQHGLDTDMSAMWDDPSFNNLQYEHLATTDSPFDANGLFDFGATANVESPNFAVRTPSKSGYEGEAGPLPPQTLPIHARSLIHPGSAESSSQDSSSESSTRRKRKTTSESPPTNKLPPEEETIKSEDLMMDQQDLSAYQNFGTSMHNLSLDRDFASQNVAMGGNFDFGSNPNSPGMMDNAAARIQTQAHMQGSLPNALQPQTSNEAPVWPLFLKVDDVTDPKIGRDNPTISVLFWLCRRLPRIDKGRAWPRRVTWSYVFECDPKFGQRGHVRKQSYLGRRNTESRMVD